MINSIVYIGYAEGDDGTSKKQGNDTERSYTERLRLSCIRRLALFTLSLIVTLLVDPNRRPQLAIHKGHLR